MRLLARTVVLATAVLLLTAAPAFAAEITLTEDGFDPDSVEVTEGTTVVWRNATDETQTVVAEDGSWDSGPVEAGESFSIRVRDVGEIRYTTEDASAEGRIVVVAAVDEDPDDEVDDADEEEETALPTTGAEPLVLLAVALILFGSGSLLVRRAGT